MKLGIIRGFKLDQAMIESPTFHLVDAPPPVAAVSSSCCLFTYLLSTSQRGCSKKEST